MKDEAERLYKEREERLQDAVSLKAPDRVPVICCADGFAWKYAGISGWDYMVDNEKFMAAQTKFFLDFQPDAVWQAGPLDPLTMVIWQPCQTKFPVKDLPPDSIHQIMEKEIMKEEDYEYAHKHGYMQLLLKLLPKLRPDTPNVRRRFLDKMKAEGPTSQVGPFSNIRRFRELGFTCYFGGGCESPIGLLTLMRSYPRFVLDLYRNFDMAARTVERFDEEIATMSIDACKFSGIPRAVISLHRESSSFFSLKIFEDLCLPEIKRLVELHSREGIKSVLHMDGDWTPNLPYLRELPKGCCVIQIDEDTDPLKAKEILGDRQCIDAGPMEIRMARSTPAKIEEHCKKLIDVVGEGGGFILKSELPPDPKPENIRAMINIAKTYGVYRT